MGQTLNPTTSSNKLYNKKNTLQRASIVSKGKSVRIPYFEQYQKDGAPTFGLSVQEPKTSYP